MSRRTVVLGLLAVGLAAAQPAAQARLLCEEQGARAGCCCPERSAAPDCGLDCSAGQPTDRSAIVPAGTRQLVKPLAAAETPSVTDLASVGWGGAHGVIRVRDTLSLSPPKRYLFHCTFRL